MSGFVVDIVDLPRTVSATKDVHLDIAAPDDLGTDVISVPAGSKVSVDASLIAMDDGVLVRGSADLALHGQCVRCLCDLDEQRTVTFDELYFFPDAAAAHQAEGDDEAEDVFLVGETTLDLEPAVRDALVLGLPFQPLCTPDCAGLCTQCGDRLDDLPADHHHEVRDARWSALAALLPDGLASDASEDGAADAHGVNAAKDATSDAAIELSHGASEGA